MFFAMSLSSSTLAVEINTGDLFAVLLLAAMVEMVDCSSGVGGCFTKIGHVGAVFSVITTGRFQPILDALGH
jgi:hypothetical protein